MKRTKKTKVVVKGPWSSPPAPAPWPAIIGELRPMHALLIAFDASPNAYFDELFERLRDEHGFKEMAIAMAYRNALSSGYLALEFVSAVGKDVDGEDFTNGRKLVRIITDHGHAKLAALNAKMERRPAVIAAVVAERQGSLFDGGGQ